MATKTKNDVENQAVAVLPASEEVAVVLSNQTVTLIQEIVSIKTDTLRFLEATVSQVNRNAFEIGKRVGHSAEKITLRYAHLFPNKQDAMADFLDNEFGGEKPGDESKD